MLLNRIICNYLPVISAIRLVQRLNFTPRDSVFVKVRNMASGSGPFANIPIVDIDNDGVFKYILMRVHDKKNDEENITILRGYQRHPYHSDIYEEVQALLEPLDCEVTGGGRINHNPDTKEIHIYGYSQGFGKADHQLSAKLIKEHYPKYKITISDEGY